MRLRAHHLICLHFFKGEGYTDEYVENLKSILERVKREKQEDIEVVMGADEVCRPCPYLKNDICKKGEEQIAELDLLAMDLLKIKPGDRISWEHAESKLSEIIEVWKRYACFDCEYAEICSKDEKWSG